MWVQEQGKLIMFRKLSIIGAIAAVVMMPTALSVQMGEVLLAPASTAQSATAFATQLDNTRQNGTGQ